jgi:hypothetical protein
VGPRPRPAAVLPLRPAALLAPRPVLEGLWWGVAATTPQPW